MSNFALNLMEAHSLEYCSRYGTSVNTPTQRETTVMEGGVTAILKTYRRDGGLDWFGLGNNYFVIDRPKKKEKRNGKMTEKTLVESFRVCCMTSESRSHI